jgi:hypothetical protein
MTSEESRKEANQLLIVAIGSAIGFIGAFALGLKWMALFQ